MSELEDLNVFIRRPHQLAKPLQDKLENLLMKKFCHHAAWYRCLAVSKLMNKKINIFVDLSNEVGKQTAIVQLPTVIKRFYELSHEGKHTLFLLKTLLKSMCINCLTAIKSTEHSV